MLLRWMFVMTNITEHKFTDNDNILDITIDDGCIVIDYDENTSTTTISKSDAIAIANHFRDNIYFNVDTQQFEEMPHTG